jgi:hypothetical protein
MDVSVRTENQTNEIPHAVLVAAAAGRKIDAIKLLRDARGIGLKEAKEAVEAIPLPEAARAQGRSMPRSEGGGSRLLLTLIVIGALFTAGYFLL